MKRLFTFGCSFTNYIWPTWADILGLEYDHYENWGWGSGSNEFIMYSLSEMLAKNTITQNDTIIVYWTSFNRLSKFNNNKWNHNVNYNMPESEEIPAVVSNITIINLVKELLDRAGCKYHFLSLMNINDKNHWYLSKKNYNSPAIKEIRSTYKSALTAIHPSFFNLVFNYNHLSRANLNIKQTTDFIPLISKGLEQAKIEQFKNDYNNIREKSWPDVNEIVNEDFSNTADDIKEEILYHFRVQLDEINSRAFARNDFHPTPKEHLEYLSKLGIFNISSDQIETVNTWDYNLCNGIEDTSFLKIRNNINRLGLNTML